MTAHVQKLSEEIWLIRFGEVFAEYGDAYDGVCTFIRVTETSGTIIGMAGQFNKKSFAAIKKVLILRGIECIEYERRNKNEREEHTNNFNHKVIRSKG